MKLLFDENLSRYLSKNLADLFPGSLHVRDAGMTATDDAVIWEYAKEQGFIVVTKDSGFHQRSVIAGFPPKIIWIQTGNCPADYVEKLLRHHAIRLQEFAADERFAYITLK